MTFPFVRNAVPSDWVDPREFHKREPSSARKKIEPDSSGEMADGESRDYYVSGQERDRCQFHHECTSLA
jgi:hypothetical protein